MRWPKALPAGKTYPYRASTLDLLPTCLEAAGIPAGESARLDGTSFLQAVQSGVKLQSFCKLTRAMIFP
jgi:arylsulfatase A-like enzyme